MNAKEELSSIFEVLPVDLQFLALCIARRLVRNSSVAHLAPPPCDDFPRTGAEDDPPRK